MQLAGFWDDGRHSSSHRVVGARKQPVGFLAEESELRRCPDLMYTVRYGRCMPPERWACCTETRTPGPLRLD